MTKKDAKSLTIQERLKGLADLLPAFQEREDRQKESPFTVSSAPLVGNFHQAAYDYDWVQGVNWVEWKQTPEAAMLRDDPDALAQATEQQLIDLITTCVRQERFCDGTLESLYRSGVLIRILRRAASMLEELEDKHC